MTWPLRLLLVFGVVLTQLPVILAACYALAPIVVIGDHVVRAILGRDE
mgnify:CR=1 FL=1